MGSLQALQNWCRIKCENYPNVEIRNMSSSFRDGLAFCAIIHKHRPDLIDFYSLSKDNIYENNRLAFEVAEFKLGIPALLDPADMVCGVPDHLSVITYLSQYYLFFNRISHDPSHLLKRHLASPQAPETPTSSAGGQTGAVSQSNRGRPTSICASCMKHVHLVQRHLVEGKLYHRSCFRCSVCGSALLPGSYREGRETGSLVCAYHWTANQNARADLSRQADVASTEHLPKLGGQEVTSSQLGQTHSPSPSLSFSHSAEKTESRRERVVPRVAEKDPRLENREVRHRERNTDPASGSMLRDRLKKLPPPPQIATEEGPLADAQSQTAGAHAGSQETETKKTDSYGGLTPVSASNSALQGGVCRPVPAPRRILNSSVPPCPVPRASTVKAMDSSSATSRSADLRKSPPSSAGASRKPKDPPWMSIVHPGPWSRLPPAPPPMKPVPSRFGSLPSLHGTGEWFWKRLPPANPFGEDEDEDDTSEDRSDGTSETEDGGTTEALGQDSGLGLPKAGADLSDLAGPAGLGGLAEEASGLGLPKAGADLSDLAGPRGLGGLAEEASGLGISEVLKIPDSAVAASCSEVRDVCEPCDLAGLVGLQGLPFPSSVSEPAIFSASHSPSPPALSTNRGAAGPSESGSDTETLSDSKEACKENPFDRTGPPLGTPVSKTSQGNISRRASAPGHGFPLIRRKVQTDHVTPERELQEEKGELVKQMDMLETRGVELETSLRDCQNHQEEEDMLGDWFTLIHQKHKLVRRDTELVHLTKQQHLEERQADVEYQLRCLLNRPESEWSKDDRSQEQKLMDELVSVIGQRDQIINGLDQDRQRSFLFTKEAQ